MQTVIIFDDTSENIKFFIVDGDKSHLNGIYINNTQEKNKARELKNLIYDDKGYFNFEILDDFPTNFVQTNLDCKVIICGFVS